MRKAWKSESFVHLNLLHFYDITKANDCSTLLHSFQSPQQTARSSFQLFISPKFLSIDPFRSDVMTPFNVIFHHLASFYCLVLRLPSNVLLTMVVLSTTIQPTRLSSILVAKVSRWGHAAPLAIACWCTTNERIETFMFLTDCQRSR